MDRRVFGSTTDDSWPPEEGTRSIDGRLDIAQTCGGISAMLFHVANSGDQGVAACRLAFDLDHPGAAGPQTAVLAPMQAWLKEGLSEASKDFRPRAEQGTVEAQQRIFWAAVSRLSAWRGSTGTETATDVLLDLLHDGAHGLKDSLKAKFRALESTLESLAGFGNISPSETFRKFPSPFSRAMLLFVLCRSCRDLLEYDDPQLNESDRIAAAVLIAAKEGWERLPLDLREVPGLANAVSHRMAETSHRHAGTGLSLGPAPPRCRPLRELFVSRPKWLKAHRQAALLLARKYRWDCLQTTIRLGKGAYELLVEGSGLRLVLQGEAKAVAVEVQRDGFLRCLAETRISSALETSVRKMIRD